MKNNEKHNMRLMIFKNEGKIFNPKRCFVRFAAKKAIKTNKSQKEKEKAIEFFVDPVSKMIFKVR